VSATLTVPRRDRFLRSVIQALVSIPIWLIFVLLSPFDAYAAAKNVTKGGEQLSPQSNRSAATHVMAVTDAMRNVV
jgi:hypothetical protein